MARDTPLGLSGPDGGGEEETLRPAGHVDRNRRQGADLARVRYRTGNEGLDRTIAALVESAGVSPDEDLIFEMIVSAVRMGREAADRGELKLVSAALKELRYSFLVFDPYTEARKASIFGSARITEGTDEYEVARDLGAALADAGWMVITGAGPGIMQAGVEGAGLENSFGVSIQLPFESVPAFLAGDPKLINFRYFFTRKVTFMKQSDGFVLLPGGFGTMDEAFELLTLQQTGRTALTPVVLLDPPGSTYWESWVDFVQRELAGRDLISPDDLALVRIAHDVDEACEELTSFYAVYHSARYVGKRLVLRLQAPIDDALLARCNDEFADLLVEGVIERIEVTEPERADDDHVHLPRLGLRFDRRSTARLRLLIDTLNGRR
jgi:uncharacterized protein (TIGR00730 family)